MPSVKLSQLIKMQTKKSQLSLEFVVMMSMGIIFVMLLLVFGNEVLLGQQNYQKYAALRDYGYVLQSEFILAASSERGYERVFFVPPRIDNIDYELKNTNNSFYINYKDMIFTYFIPEIKGNISKGYNKIITNQTAISINATSH